MLCFELKWLVISLLFYLVLVSVQRRKLRIPAWSLYRILPFGICISRQRSPKFLVCFRLILFRRNLPRWFSCYCDAEAVMNVFRNPPPTPTLFRHVWQFPIGHLISEYLRSWFKRPKSAFNWKRLALFCLEVNCPLRSGHITMHFSSDSHLIVRNAVMGNRNNPPNASVVFVWSFWFTLRPWRILLRFFLATTLFSICYYIIL